PSLTSCASHSLIGGLPWLLASLHQLLLRPLHPVRICLRPPLVRMLKELSLLWWTPLGACKTAPAPPVLHPLASGVSGNTPSMSASFKCHFCDHFSKTQKGLNHHLVRAHRYGVAPRERRVAVSSPPVSSQCESISAIPSGFPDSALGPDSPVVVPAPSDPLPSADATFVISPVKLSSFHRRTRGRRDRRRPSQQPPTPAVESATSHSNISRLRYDPAEASKLQRAYRVSPQKTLDQILGGASPFCAIPQEHIVAHFSEVFLGEILLRTFLFRLIHPLRQTTFCLPLCPLRDLGQTRSSLRFCSRP
ncbi:hypothetical protein TNCT_268621, partial [Trichonephila clavata]